MRRFPDAEEPQVIMMIRPERGQGHDVRRQEAWIAVGGFANQILDSNMSSHSKKLRIMESP